MISIQAHPLAIAYASAALLLLAFVIIRRKALIRRAGDMLSHAKPIVALSCVPTGFLLMELPYNPLIAEINPALAIVGLGVTAAVFMAVFFLGQRTKTAMATFCIACFSWGTANYFVASFKGQPILPSDIVALQTAASVSGGYAYTIGSSVLVAAGMLFSAIAAIVMVPGTPITKRSAVVNASAGASVLLAFGMWFCAVDIEKNYDCSVDVWSSLDSYQKNGSLLCLLQRTQKLSPDAPEGYSAEEAARIRREKTQEALASQAVKETPASAPSVRPAIVAVMSETFSDLSRYPNLAPVYEGPAAFNSIDDALAKGDCYVSAMGGGTCNSEFEFLTGSSMGLLGAGVYPYMLYDLSHADNLAGYLASLGYETSAIHPAAKENWRRDRVYAQLGFNAFYDEKSFQDAETFRNMVTDGATYEKTIELLEQNDAPQFIFNVTIASHGGYGTGLVDEADMVRAPLNGMQYAEINEYLSCIKRSDAEFKRFLDDLRELDRPVIVCYFGDHQPGFVEQLAEDAYGNVESVGTESSAHNGDSELAQAALSPEQDTPDGKTHNMSDIELVQERYVTPYVIWTNSDELREAAKANGRAIGDTSLNYLGAALLQAAGLPLNEHFAFNLAMREEIPAINLNGYQDTQGEWHRHGETGRDPEPYRQLAMVEHDNLFGKK